ncbi:MAG: hypothetical protein P8L46_10235 [Acidimicrobiales bacterium]|nr:hypothetical protein [Acidimicrobiales bacterium]
MKKIPRIMISFFRLAAAALVLAVLASACGGDEVATDGDAAVAVTDDGDDDVEMAGIGRAFCDIFREQDARLDSFDPFSVDPEGAEAFFDNQLALLTEGIAAAPTAEIKADLEVIQVGQIEIASMLRAVDWDVFALDFAAVEELNDEPVMNAASDRLDMYGATECGISPDDDDDDDDAAGDEDFGSDPDMLAMMLNNPAMRDLMVEEMVSDSGLTEDQANCYLDGLIESGVLEALEGDVGEDMEMEQMMAMFEIFDDCGIDPNTFG